MVLLCGTDGGDEQTADIAAELFGMVVRLLVDAVCLEQELQPIAGFVGFLQGNFQLGYEIFSTLCILGFVDICTDGGPGSTKLLCHIRTLGDRDMIHQIHNDSGKFQ